MIPFLFSSWLPTQIILSSPLMPPFIFPLLTNELHRYNGQHIYLVTASQLKPPVLLILFLRAISIWCGEESMAERVCSAQRQDGLWFNALRGHTHSGAGLSRWKSIFLSFGWTILENTLYKYEGVPVYLDTQLCLLKNIYILIATLARTLISLLC